MGWKSSLTIHASFWSYLALGGVAFYYMEKPSITSDNRPVNQSIMNAAFCLRLVDAVLHNAATMNSTPGSLMMMSRMVGESCANLTEPEAAPSDGGEDDLWEYSAGLFLSMTILTTIGYGDYYPKTNGGKIFTIIYGFIGIPLTGLLLASTSDYFSNGLVRVYEKQRKERDERMGIFIAAVVFLLPGLAAFVFIPAGILIVIEGWTYLDALYFCFVTLTTIGFGDLVAGHHAGANWKWIYRVSLITWIIAGISYWAIIISFVTKAFKSKEIRRRWVQTSQAIAQQASEMRRAIGSHKHEAFVAQKSKTAFEFAMQLAGSMSHLPTEEVDHQLTLPGIATALKPHGRHLGLRALMSVLMVGLRHNPDGPHAIEAAPTENRDQRDPHPAMNAFQIHTISEDSGLDRDTIHTIGSNESLPYSTTSRRQQPKLSGLGKQVSTVSLPNNIPSGRPQEEGVKHGRWKKMMRSSTQPELQKKSTAAPISSPDLHKLFMEALCILQEAKEQGAHLDDVVPTP